MIRYAKTDDASQICKIYNHYVLGTTITFEEEPVSADDMAQRIAETLQSLPWLVWEQDEGLRGFCAPTQLEDVSVFSCIVHCWTNCASENSILSLGA
jgi:L-amino acid N-acyltransferase YncA